MKKTPATPSKHEPKSKPPEALPAEKISLEDLDQMAGGVFVPPKPS